MELEPLTSAEPIGFGAAAGEDETPAHLQDSSSAGGTASREITRRTALGLTPETVHEEIPEPVSRLREHVRLAQARIEDLRDMRVPEMETDDLRRAWDVLADRPRDAIIQPPRAEIRPAGEILKWAQERSVEQEAEPA